MQSVLLDVAGHRRSPATMPGYHRGRPPRNKGEQYPADPPTVEEVIAVMRILGDRPDGHRLRALIVLLWRAGLRISEALSLQESDLDRTPRGGTRPAWKGRQATRGRDGPLGMGPARPLARDPLRASDRRDAEPADHDDGDRHNRDGPRGHGSSVGCTRDAVVFHRNCACRLWMSAIRACSWSVSGVGCARAGGSFR